MPSDHGLLTWGRGNTVDITSWIGIKVEDQRVAAILLPRKGISGTIPPELSRLTHLTQLNLAGNGLRGQIPSQLSLLTKLEVLYLYSNELSGPIPVEFSRLTNLKRLKLGINRLTGQIPSQIFRLTNLETFDIIDNEITGQIPIEFTRLTNLTWLNLANNSFTGSIPTQLSRLTKLELLNLYGNELSGPIPVELINLPNLKGLHLGGNDLTGQIPAELSQLTKLEALSLSRNSLTGSIPTELSQLTNLKELDLEENELTGSIPSQLSLLTNLRILNLKNNQLTGPIPPELSKLIQLRYLYLGVNRLTGSIPPQFSRLTYLIVLDISYNQLSGTIPPELSQLEYLRSLILEFNLFTDPTPAQITEQDGPADLDPADDCSNGTFVADPSAAPGLVADCRALVSVRNHWIRHPDNADLPSDHDLLAWGRGNTVDITSWSGIKVKDQRVTAVLLPRKGISGTIPPELSRLTNLETLSLRESNLTGSIPPELSELTNLRELTLDENLLTGSIPSQLSLLTNLTWLHLGGNELTGRIPLELSKLTNLERLSLRENNLTGSIPPELSELTNLRELTLDENLLTGSIPSQLSLLTNLRNLNLNNNQLTGLIPPQFSQLTNLIFLDLSYNQLSGPIPPELFQLKYLRHLSLFFNQFTDPIPPQIIKREELNIRSPFDTDLGLVVNVEEYRKISLGNNLWEVWLCDTGGPLDLDIDRVTDLLNRTVSPYFEWLSEGLFTPRFSAIGTITLTPRELANLPNTPPGSFSFHPLVACEDKMMRSVAHDKMNKAVIIDNAAHSNGLSLPHALAGGGSVMPIPGYDLTPRLMTVAHEMGHVLGWPHSYNGYMIYEGVLDDYDNSADIMSRGNNKDLSTGTPAINRYAAGWIDPEDVVIYSGEATTHELSPIGVDGTQMLIVPSEEGQGIFYSLSPVIAEGYNRDQPKEGVEVYFIDQGPSICDLNIQTTLPCRRTQPYPPQTEEPVRGSVYHVRGVGDVSSWGRYGWRYGSGGGTVSR